MSDQENTSINIGEKKEYFAWLPNCIVYEWGLSAEALAAALYLNGKPSDWQARPFDIKAHFNWGDRIWYRVSKELKSFGLLHERSTPLGKELWFELPEMNLTIHKKPTLQNVKLTKRNLTKRKDITKKDIPEKDLLKNKDILCATKNFLKEAFERLWEYYPVKKGKQNAYNEFLKLTKGLEPHEVENLTKTIWDGIVGLLQEDRWLKEMNQRESFKVFIPELPHGATWFRQHRWEDSYENDPQKFMASIKSKYKGGKK